MALTSRTFTNHGLARIPKAVLLLPLLLVWASHPSPPQGAPVVLDRCRLDRPVAQQPLPDDLAEVSGLVAAGREVLAHDDERGRLYLVDPVSGRVARRSDLRDRPRDDFEGVAQTPAGLVLMTSRGTLYFLEGGGDSSSAGDGNGHGGATAAAELDFERIDTGFGRFCELEGLAYDPRSDVLLIPCKEPRDPRFEGSLILLRWALARGTPADPGQLLVPAPRLAGALGVPRIRPTAVEWDAVTGRILVLSALPQALVEIDSTGALRTVVRLDPRRHPQPEGLTLLADRLLIADEGAGVGPATLTSYLCSP